MDPKLSELVKEEKLSQRVALLFHRAGLKNFQSISENHADLNSLLFERKVPISFFIDIVPGTYGGLKLCIVHAEGINLLCASSRRTTEVLKREHPASNNTIIRNAKLLINTLQENNLTLDHFFRSKVASDYFHRAYSQYTVSTTSKTKWIEELIIEHKKDAYLWENPPVSESGQYILSEAITLHIFMLLDPAERGVAALVCSDWMMLLSRKKKIDPQLREWVTEQKLWLRTALILERFGFKDFYPYLKHEVAENTEGLNRLLLGYMIPQCFFREIIPGSGVDSLKFCMIHAENINLLRVESSNIVTALKRNHPGINSTIIRNAKVLISTLRDKNFTLDDFLQNSDAISYFHFTYSGSSDSNLDKTVWIKKLLLNQTQSVRSMSNLRVHSGTVGSPREVRLQIVDSSTISEFDKEVGEERKSKNVECATGNLLENPEGFEILKKMLSEIMDVGMKIKFLDKLLEGYIIEYSAKKDESFFASACLLSFLRMPSLAGFEMLKKFEKVFARNRMTGIGCIYSLCEPLLSSLVPNKSNTVTLGM